MKYFVVLILSVIFLSSCLDPKPLDIDVPDAKSKIVVCSFVVPNEVMVVGLTRSFSALYNPPHDSTGNNVIDSSFFGSLLVSNAKVWVTYNNTTDTLHMIEPGVYASVSTLITPYAVYELHAKDYSTGEEITALSTMLPKVTFDSIRITVNRQLLSEPVKVSYSFRDIPGEENYYMVYFNNNVSPTALAKDFFQINGSKLDEMELYTDRNMDNGGVTITDRPLNVGSTRDTIGISLVNISKGYYEFLTAYKRSNKLFNQITGEPINYPSNVQNGYGFFNTHARDGRIFDLSKY